MLRLRAILEDSSGFSSIWNSKGLFAYSQESELEFTVTMRTNDGTGSVGLQETLMMSIYLMVQKPRLLH